MSFFELKASVKVTRVGWASILFWMLVVLAACQPSGRPGIDYPGTVGKLDGDFYEGRIWVKLDESGDRYRDARKILVSGAMPLRVGLSSEVDTFVDAVHLYDDTDQFFVMAIDKAGLRTGWVGPFGRDSDLVV